MANRRRTQVFLLLFSLLLAGTWLVFVSLQPTAGDEQSPAASAGGQVATATNSYMGREIAATIHYSGATWLMRESRQREENCRELLKQLSIKPGQVICDMGCGNGFYTLPLARLAGPQGKVYAVDVQQEMLDMLKRRALQASARNIVPVLGSETDPGLPAGSLDLVLMVDVYHEFSNPAAMLDAIRTSLKPTGRIALAEFREEDAGVPIKPLHKMSKEQILEEFSANGLKLVGQFDGLPWQHLMFFSPTDAPQAESAPMSDKFVRTEQEWRKLLSPDQYHVLREKGTERPFVNKYDKLFEPGTYYCAACGQELFRSDAKFNSGCGWPAFYAAKAGDRVTLSPDFSHGMVRTEVTCARCGSHLGHVFYDAPQTPTGQRYCINSISLKFVPAEEGSRRGKSE
jgi:methionine-R-sulfoxide reductase